MLPKMSAVESIDPNNEKDLWLALFNAETEEELEELSRNGGAFMGEAIKAYHGITASEEFKNLEWLRAKTRHDEAQALSNARKKGAEAERKKFLGVIDALIGEKDASIEEKNAENAELRAQLETLRTQLSQ